MRWERGQRSSNIEDRRGQGAGKGGGAARGGLSVGGLRLGWKALLLIGILSLITGQNFFAMLAPLMGGGISNPAGTPSQPYQPSAQEEQLADFTSFVLDDTEKVWNQVLPQQTRQPYVAPKLVLFNGAVRSGCGHAEAAMGPFYCPADSKVYIDLGFYGELKQRFGAPGDFAQAYVIAHEIGHHIQNQLGLSGQVQEAQRNNPQQANQLSVRLELQADCIAGIWAKSTAQRGLLEQGDVEEGIAAAAAVGDDRIQKQASGRVNPEGWTHGSSQQRVAWFMQGMRSGDLQQCDTFQTQLAEDQRQ